MRARALTLLVILYVFNFVDRNLLSILLTSIKEDLEVSDTLMGFLMGPGFAFFYTFAGIPIARLADRYARRTVMAVGLALWSLATAASGVVRNFGEMAVARVLVGVGEASATPSAHSLISDLFPPTRRASALAIYNMGASIGIFFGLALGGWLHDSIGWRNAFLILGLPGVLFALVIRFGLPEPRRGASEGLEDSGEPPAFCAGADLSHLGSSQREGLLNIYEGFLRFGRCPLPTIAAVNGAAVGAGMNLALVCDDRIAAERARFDTRFLQLGLHPGGGHTWMYPYVSINGDRFSINVEIVV